MSKNYVNKTQTIDDSFLKEFKLSSWINCHEDYEVSYIKEYKKKNAFNVRFKGKEIATVLKKHAFKKFLIENFNIAMDECVSRIFLPTEAMIVNSNKTFFIIEVKYQKVEGSADQKLQSCDFKKKQWDKIASKMNLKIKYFYILNDWFKDAKYKDVLEYINNIEGCKYFFNYIPLTEFGLKNTPTKKNLSPKLKKTIENVELLSNNEN